MRFRYQDLTVGEEILQFIDLVYRLTAVFPSDERFGLTSQIRRSATSIYLNVAEGSARKSPKDFMRFLTISQGSLVETHAASIIARRQGYIKEQDFQNIDKMTQSLWFKIHALRESQARRLLS